MEEQSGSHPPDDERDGAVTPPPEQERPPVTPPPEEDLPPPGSLNSIPIDLFVDVLSYLDVASQGRAETASHGFRRPAAWRAVCAREGLSVTGCPKAAARRGATCDHADVSSDDFAWSLEDGGAVATCRACGRAYAAALVLDYVDTQFFSSKLVTRASFVARRPAPSSRREFDVVWDCKQAAASKAALAPLGYVAPRAPLGRARFRAPRAGFSYVIPQPGAAYQPLGAPARRYTNGEILQLASTPES